MRPRITTVFAAVLVLVLCQEMADRATAKLVRDDRNSPGVVPSNPAVATGGLHVPPGPPPPIPYSLIGAIASEGQWLTQCAFWPWRFLGSLSFHPSRGAGRFHRQPPIDWIPPPLP